MHLEAGVTAVRRETDFESRTALIPETINNLREMIQNEHHTMCDI